MRLVVRVKGRNEWSPTLLLIDAQDYDGLTKRDSLTEWQASRSKRAVVGDDHRPARILVIGRMRDLFNERMSVGAGIDDVETRRAAVVDLTKLAGAIVRRLEARKLSDGLRFEYWCEVLIQTQAARAQD